MHFIEDNGWLTNKDPQMEGYFQVHKKRMTENA